jgi:hypothetical protein
MTLEQVLTIANQLSLADRLRLIERILPDFQVALTNVNPMPKRSLYGLCADLGSAPSAEDIDEMRQEAWANFGEEEMF